MKSTMLALCILASSTAALAMPEFHARTSSCSEMQEALDMNGVIKIRARGLIRTKTIFAYTEPECTRLQMKVPVVVRAADVFSCEVGLRCEDDRSLRGDCYPSNNPGRCL